MRKPLLRVHLIALLSLLSLLALPQPAAALSCVRVPDAEALRQADVAFRGRAIERGYDDMLVYSVDGSAAPRRVELITFEVEQTLKGSAVPRIVVRDNSLISGSRFTLGKHYLVYADTGVLPRDYPDWPAVGACSNTREVGAGGGPLAGMLWPGDAAVGSPFPALVSAAIAMLGALLLARRGGRLRGRMLLVGATALVGGGVYVALTFTRVPAAASGAAPVERAPTTMIEFGFEPRAVALDRDGNLYVADTAQEGPKRGHRVLKFSPSGEQLARWEDGADANSPILLPSDLAVDGSGNVYVVEARGRVRTLSTAGATLGRWDDKRAASLALDEEGNVYVVDNFGHHIQKLSPTGALLAQWGSEGDGRGEFRRPVGVAVDREGNVYVTDQANSRVQKFSPSGKPLAHWGEWGIGPGQFRDPHGIAVDAAGNVYVADRRNNRIQQFSSAGRFIRQWGSYGAQPGQFRRPMDVAVDRHGNVYVADWLNFRVQVFPPAGSP